MVVGAVWAAGGKVEAAKGVWQHLAVSHMKRALHDAGLASAQALVKGSPPPKGYGLGKGIREAGRCRTRSSCSGSNLESTPTCRCFNFADFLKPLELALELTWLEQTPLDCKSMIECEELGQKREEDPLGF